MEEHILVFADDFSIDGAPDPKIWTHAVGPKWANKESQCYVDDRIHSYVKDSQLHVVATCDDVSECRYKSARLHTLGKQHFRYGRFVARAKMPKGRGSWPAIWFMGENLAQGARWPLCGEIDLIEYAGNRSDQVSCAIHTKTYNHKINTHKGAKMKLSDASEVFHDYILDWTPESLTFSIDDQEMLKIVKDPQDTVNEWPFDQPFYLIINLAVGGWYGGKIVDDDFPYHFAIDYVKMYEKKQQ